MTPPYLLGTKFEAFRGRGGGDVQASRDLGDIVTLVDGRPELVGEIAASSSDLRRYLAQEFARLETTSHLDDVLACHLLPDAVSQGRIPLVRRRIAAIVEPRPS